MGGFGDDHHIALQQEAERRLGGGLSVFGADLFQHRIAEKVIFPLREGPPGHDLGAVFFHVCSRSFLLLEDMGLHLVDRRLDLGEVVDVQEAVWVEVGDADGPHLSAPVCLLHGPVGAVVVAEGLVDQEQVDVVAAQLL